MTTNVEQLIIQLRKAGIQLSVQGEQLKLQAESADVLTEQWVQQIRNNKEKLITYLYSNQRQSRIPQISREKPPALSFAQQRLWFLDQLEPDSAFYNIPMLLWLTGQLDVTALEASFRYLIERHESLRTIFRIENNTQRNDGQTSQLIHPPSWATQFTLIATPVTGEDEAQQQAQIEVTTPFNLSEGPLLRVQLLQITDGSTGLPLDSEQRFLLVINMHHIISDGWSMGVLIQELTHAYCAYTAAQLPTLPDLPIQYADFAAWQRGYLSGERLETQLTYWQTQLAGAPALLELPTDQPRPLVQSHRGSHYAFELDVDLTPKLNQLAQVHDATLFMVILTAFNLLLARYSRQNDIVVGSPIANRNRAEIEGLIGVFVNTLVLRTQLDDNASFIELLAQVRQTTLEAYQHQDLPFEQLVDVLELERTLSYSPLFQVMLVLQNAERRTESVGEPVESVEGMGEFDLPNLTATMQPPDFPFAKFDLTFYLTEQDNEGGLQGMIEYASDLFDEATVARMASHFTMLLEGIVAQPEQAISKLPMLTAAEYHQIVHEWNDTAVDFGKLQTISALFERQVEHTPNAVALLFENKQLTYHELNERANQLAHYLIELGVQADVLVAVAMERSMEMVVSLLAVLKAGGAYVPIDPTYPEERIRYVLADSHAQILLTQSHLSLAAFTEDNNVLDGAEQPMYILMVDMMSTLLEGQRTESPQTETSTDDLAYVIYTSGSTGMPKGIAITQKNIANFLAAMQHALGLQACDRLLAVTTISFDIAVLELYLPLVLGASVVIASDEQTTDPSSLIALMKQYQITVIQATPATWMMLTNHPQWKITTPIKVLCGGEALPIHLAEQLLDHSQSVWNMYGPTEATVWASAGQLQHGLHRVTIAQSIANTQFYILDNKTAIVPIGVAGELHIGGRQLARGYLNRPELTTERFINHPEFGRLYKTGDLCRWLSDGNIEYIGRTDFQVKLRGFRIELGEIESALLAQEGIHDTAVLAWEENGDKRLDAYLVDSGQLIVDSEERKHSATLQPCNPATLRQALAQRLPDYMIPSAFVFLDAMPLTPNGKLDRHALPAPDYVDMQREYVLPRNETEVKLAATWQEILHIEQIGVHDNFFELGGHSLLATQVISRINALFNIQLPLQDLFAQPTISGMAQALDQLITGQNLLFNQHEIAEMEEVGEL